MKEIKIIKCACGCGRDLPEYNKWGYKRKFFRGHCRGITGLIQKEILCGCGCKTKMMFLDKGGRPRKYINKHNLLLRYIIK